jgi:hypothetical protein
VTGDRSAAELPTSVTYCLGQFFRVLDPALDHDFGREPTDETLLGVDLRHLAEQ